MCLSLTILFLKKKETSFPLTVNLALKTENFLLKWLTELELMLPLGID